MRLNLRMVTELLESFGGEEAVMVLEESDGHGGKGIYAYLDDYPDEGSLYLGNVEEEQL